MLDDKHQGATSDSPPNVPDHLVGKFTPEQWARRQALAAKLKKFSTDGSGRPLTPVARQARFIIVFLLCGVALLLGGVGSLFGVVHLSNTPESADPGWARQHLGVHGGDFLAIVLGVCFLAAAFRTLLRSRRSAGSR